MILPEALYRQPDVGWPWIAFHEKETTDVRQSVFRSGNYGCNLVFGMSVSRLGIHYQDDHARDCMDRMSGGNGAFAHHPMLLIETHSSPAPSLLPSGNDNGHITCIYCVSETSV